MYNNSIETLLLRHYGDHAPTPETLEQRTIASVRQEAEAIDEQQRIATRIRNQHVSRRRVIQLVAMSSAGLGLLSAGIASVQSVVSGQDANQPAYA